MYNLESPGPNEGRMPGAGSVAVSHEVRVTRIYVAQPVRHSCNGCAAQEDDRLCYMLGDCRGIIYVEKVRL